MKKLLSLASLLMLVSVFGISNLAFAADTPPSFPDPFASDETDTPPVVTPKDDTDTPPVVTPKDPVTNPGTGTGTETGVSGTSGSSSSVGGGGTILLNKKKTTKPKPVITDQNNDGIVDTTDEEIFYAQNPEYLTETGPEVAYILLTSLLGSLGIRKLKKK